MLTAAIVSSDLTTSAQLLAGLEQTGLVSSVVQWTIPIERVPDSADQMPDVVFLDLAREPEPFFAFANQLRRRTAAAELVARSHAQRCAGLSRQAGAGGLAEGPPDPHRAGSEQQGIS